MTRALLAVFTFWMATAFADMPPSRADIVQTVRHMQALVKEQTVQLDEAKKEIHNLTTQLDEADSTISDGQRQVIEVQKAADALKQWGIEWQDTAIEAQKEVAADKVKLKRFNHLVNILAFFAAIAAALYAFEALKPAGLVGNLLTITNPVRYGAPVAVFIFVFGIVQVWLHYFL